MAITIHIYYSEEPGEPRKFAEEMVSSGVVEAIHREPGNLQYENFFPMEDQGTVLLIDSWADQGAIDAHHASPMMGQIAVLREKYDLHMRVERYVPDTEGLPPSDAAFVRT